MKKQSAPQEKKMKVAEAGILFALVLGLTIFLGVHFSGQDESTPVAADTSTSTEAINEMAAVEPEIEVITEPEVAVVSPAMEDVAEKIIAPEPQIVTYSMAEQAYFDGDFERASDLFDQYTDEHSDNAWGFYMLGLSQWKTGDTDVAEESFLAALDLNPDHQKSLVNYGRVLIDLDRAEEARVQIEIALTVNPENNAARRVLGRIQHNQGQLEEAAETYRVVLRTKQDDAWALNNLGLIRIQQERFTDAVAPLAKAASLKSDVACIQNNLGVALERTGQYILAGEAFASALSADADYEKAGISLARLDNLTEAEDIVPLDLVAVAEGFRVEAILVEDEIDTTDDAVADLATAETEAEDMEVAAIGPMILDLDSANVDEIKAIEESSTTENVEPEADGHRHR